MQRGIIGFVIYTLFGLYLANIFVEFIAIPEFITNYNHVISFIGGFLLIFAGVNYLRIRMLKRPKRSKE